MNIIQKDQALDKESKGVWIFNDFFEAVNPFTLAIKEHVDFSIVFRYLFSAQFISGLFLLLIHLAVILVSVLLWPYGLLYVFCILMGRKIASAIALLRSSETGAEFVAHGFSLLMVYFPLLIVSAIISLPLFAIQYCAKIVSNDPQVIGVAFSYIMLVVVALAVVAVIVGLIIAFIIYILFPLAVIGLILAYIASEEKK